MRTIVIACSLLLAACGASPGDGASSGAGGAGGAGAVTGAGGYVVQPDDPPNPEHGGVIEVLSGELQGDTGPVVAAIAFATFWDAPGAKAGACTVTTEGACTVTRCTGGTPATATAASAGTITVKGSTTLELVPKAVEYDPAWSAGALWSPGDTITITAAGAAVPAFERHVKTSSAVAVTAPTAPPKGGTLAVDRMKDVAFAWSGGSVGLVTLLWKSDATDPFTAVRCTFDSAEGAGTVPTAALQAFPAKSSGALLVLGGAPEATEAGDYSIQIIVDTVPAWGAENGIANFVATD